MNNFAQLVNTRQSTRRYTSKPVEIDKLNRCLEMARLAPSASNSQPWTFIVVTESKLCKKLASETYSPLVSFNKFVLQATAIVVMVIEKPPLVTQIGGLIKKKEYSLIDIGIAAEHFCLQATEDGLGTCILGWFNESPIKKLLNIPKGKTIGLIISVGYPPEDYKLREKTRKSFDEIVRYNNYEPTG